MRNALICTLALALASPILAQPSPNPVDGLAYDVDFFPGTTYDPSIPTPESVLGFRPGDRAAFPAEIEKLLEVWDEASPRTRLVEYARSHEGRALYYMVVTSPENMARLAEIKEGIGRLADPRGISEADAEGLVTSLPAVAWVAYSIHGDETSGADGSLATLYHLIAGTSADLTDILDQVVVLIDPMENPDGRHRFLQQVAEHRATTPNVDDQSLIHTGYWPWGRTNHYGFDLNRDWTLGVNPESRGRIQAAGEWHPQLMVDAHEMGAQDTYLFSPAADPRNPHIPESLRPWAARFARDQSEAFDDYNWVYYTGEWNEGWYPGYTDTWAEFRGALGILYEQASYAEDGVAKAGGDLETYREAVHHQAVSSIANLTSLEENREAMLRDFLADRRAVVAPSGPYAGRTFAVLPTANRGRLEAFLDLMDLQGFEVYVTTDATPVGRSVDQFGRSSGSSVLPAGTYLLPNRQPEGRLLATMLEFDARIPPDYLERERTSIVRDGQSTIYDVTAWNMTMMYGLEALTLAEGLPRGAQRVEFPLTSPATSAVDPEAVAWFVDGTDDRSVALAARLMERGAQVRIVDKDVSLGGMDFPRGSIVVLPSDNGHSGEVAGDLDELASELDLAVGGVATGLGEGELPDIGGGHFLRLEMPRIALLSRGGISNYDFGSIWHTIDQQLGIRHSQLDGSFLNFADLRRYNVLVLPDRWFDELSAGSRAAIKTWVEAGGTLIATAGSAAEIASGESEISTVRRLRDVLGDLDAYEEAVLREVMARERVVPPSDDVWTYVLRESSSSYPWSGLGDVKRPTEDELERRDSWDRMFMPPGAFIAARADQEHWLTFGVSEELPVLVNRSTVLMAKGSAEAPVRFGLTESRSGTEARRLGWASIGADRDLRLRMSGLLWPEAAARIANSAAVTRESLGNGQVILFANTPTFRASTRGTARLLINAMIYGPGLGAYPSIEP